MLKRSLKTPELRKFHTECKWISSVLIHDNAKTHYLSGASAILMTTLLRGCYLCKQAGKYIKVIFNNQLMTWWCHQMEIFSALPVLCAGKGSSPITGEFSSQKPVRRSFGDFFKLYLNKRLIKHNECEVNTFQYIWKLFPWGIKFIWQCQSLKSVLFKKY